MSCRAYKSGILTYRFLSSPTMSKLGYTTGFSIISLSGNGGGGVTSSLGLFFSIVFPPCSVSFFMTTVEGVISGCTLFSFSFSWWVLLYSGEIIFLDLNRISLHPTELISPSTFSIICISWVGLLLGFGWGWAGNWGHNCDWGLLGSCSGAWKVDWVWGVIPMG